MKRLFVPLALVTLAASCAPPQTETPEITSETSAALWLAPSVTLWPHSGTGPASIYVCFRNSTDFSATTRSHIRTIVEENWERAAFIDFWDWGVCATPLPTSNSIIVMVDSTVSGSVADVGLVSGRANVVRFQSTSPTDHLVLGAFGSSLGFAHENNDSPMSCTQRTTGGISEENQADEALSVMSQSPCNNATALSSWDILGVRKVYGLKRTGTIAGMGGLALNIAGGSLTTGQAIVGWPAQGGANDLWTETTDTIYATNAGGFSFLDLSFPGPLNGNYQLPAGFWPLQTAVDNGANEQNLLFSFIGMEWHAMGNMCVTADSSSANAKLSIQPCNGSSLQKWNFDQTFHKVSLTASSGSLCVTVPSGTPAVGMQLFLADCTLANGGIFLMNNHLSYEEGPLCFNVFGGTTTPGNRLGLWDGCTTVPTLQNEAFTFEGQIHTYYGNDCMNLQGGVPFDGVPIGMFPCQGNGTPNEIWEIY